MRLLTLFILMLIHGCNIAGDNSNQIISEISNKKGKKAVLFKKFGGATVTNSIQVALLDNQEKLTNEHNGNVFTCPESSNVIVKWLNDDSLQVQHSANAKTYIKQTKVENVTIVYKVQ